MEKKKKYVRIEEKSTTGKKLQALMTRCEEADHTAREWAREHGAVIYYESSSGIAGGIDAVEFDTEEERDGWECMETVDGRNLYFPKPGSNVEKEIEGLPIISIWAFLKVFDYDMASAMIRDPFNGKTPLLFRYDGNWYAEVPLVSYADDVYEVEEKTFYRKRMAALNTLS